MLNGHNEDSKGLTQIMLRDLTSEELDLLSAVKQLKENAQVRTIRETLAKLSNISMEDKKSFADPFGQNIGR